MIGCRQLIKAEFGRLLPSLVGLHMTYILHAARFKNFSYMVNVWPECSNKVLTFQQNESMYLVTEEEIVSLLKSYYSELLAHLDQNSVGDIVITLHQLSS